MATKAKATKGEKSAAMHAYLELDPDALAAEVVSALKKQGIKINLASVYNYRSTAKKAGTIPAQKPAVQAAPNAASEHGSKSQAVRAAITELGRNTPSKEIIDHLATKGIPVSLALVVKVKSRMKARRKAKRARLANVTSPKAATTPAARKPSQVSFDDLIAAKELADRLGGMDSLRRTMDVLEKLR